MLGEVPMDWQQTTIGEVASLNDESLSSKTPKDYEFRYVSIDDVSTGSINGWTSLAFAEAPSRARRIARQGDILLSTVRPYLKSFTRVNGDDTDLVVSTGFAVLRAGAQINPVYLYQLIFSEPFIKHLKELMTGSNYPAVKPKDIAVFPFALPPVNEQHRIAEILSSVDASIQATQAAIEQAERVKRGLMEELLTGGLGSEAIERGELPKGWITKTLTEIAKVATGKHDANHATEGGRYRFYTCAADFFACNTKRFSGGCIILPGNGANVGEVYYYDGEFDAYQRTYVVSEIDVNKRFLLHHLKKYWRERNVNKQYGSATNFLKMGNFKTYKVCLPPQSEQERIAEILSSIDEFIASQKLVVEQQSRAKRGLMDDLLTGKVRTV